LWAAALSVPSTALFLGVAQWSKQSITSLAHRRSLTLHVVTNGVQRSPVAICNPYLEGAL